MLFNFPNIWEFSRFLLLTISDLIPFDQRTYLNDLILRNIWSITYDLVLWMFHLQSNRICILLLFGKEFCKCQLTVLFTSSTFLRMIFCVFVLPISKRRALMYPPVMMDFFVGHFNTVTFCFMYLEAGLLGKYTFKIVLFS